MEEWIWDCKGCGGICNYEKQRQKKKKETDDRERIRRNGEKIHRKELKISLVELSQLLYLAIVYFNLDAAIFGMGQIVGRYCADNVRLITDRRCIRQIFL